MSSVFTQNLRCTLGEVVLQPVHGADPKGSLGLLAPHGPDLWNRLEQAPLRASNTTLSKFLFYWCCSWKNWRPPCALIRALPLFSLCISVSLSVPALSPCPSLCLCRSTHLHPGARCFVDTSPCMQHRVLWVQKFILNRHITFDNVSIVFTFK